MVADESGFRIVVGDCLVALADIPPDSLDACITDPPYELGFMGRKWDSSGIAFQVETWAAVLRVLKPGASLAAFSGARTVHRMAVAIEDAGFEIRDGIDWLFGQGFPKSVDGEREVARATCEQEGRHFLRQLPRNESDRRPGDHVCARTDLSARFDGVGSALKPAREPIVLARKPLGKLTIGRCLVEHGTGGLRIDAARIGMSPEDADRIRAMGGYGRAGYEPVAGVSLAGSVDGSLARKVEDAAAHAAGRWPSNVALSHRLECRPAGRRRVRGHGFATIQRDGARSVYGQFSEAGEPVTTDAVYGTFSARSGVQHVDNDGTEAVEAWLCVDGCPVLELDREAGDRVSNAITAGTRKPDQDRGVYGRYNGGTDRPAREASSGGASRYFAVFAWLPEDVEAAEELAALPAFHYTAKADRSERDLGCDDLPMRSGGEATMRKEGTIGVENARAGAGRTSGARNYHPTVKPLGLMRWLVRLLTKPGDRVLEPFLGSGTTAMACRLEGVGCLAIEREPEYVEIAWRRIRAAEQPAMLALAEGVESGPIVVMEPAQPALFE